MQVPRASPPHFFVIQHLFPSIDHPHAEPQKSTVRVIRVAFPSSCLVQSRCNQDGKTWILWMDFMDNLFPHIPAKDIMDKSV